MFRTVQCVSCDLRYFTPPSRVVARRCRRIGTAAYSGREPVRGRRVLSRPPDPGALTGDCAALVTLVLRIGAFCSVQGAGDRQMLRGHMFVQDFVQIGRDFGEIRTLVLANPQALLAASAGAAYRDGEQILVRLAPSSKHPRFGKSVKVDLGDPYEREDHLVVPMHWWAPRVTRLYPHLDADLEFAEFGAGSTQIALIENYDPPLGAVGRQVNVILLHRVANASIRSFLTRVLRSLEQSI